MFAERGNSAKIEQLIEHNPELNINAHGFKGVSALILAARNNEASTKG